MNHVLDGKPDTLAEVCREFRLALASVLNGGDELEGFRFGGSK